MGSKFVMRCAQGEKPRAAHICLRPENLTIAGMAEPDAIPCRVVRAIYRGGVTAIEAAPDTEPRSLLFLLVRGAAPRAGEAISVSVAGGWVIPAEAGMSSPTTREGA
jgi:hypothetical protein